MANYDLATGGAGYTVGTSICVLNFTQTGLDVLNEWANGTRSNWGFSLFPQVGGVGYHGLGTREYANPDCRPKLTLTIAPD